MPQGFHYDVAEFDRQCAAAELDRVRAMRGEDAYQEVVNHIRRADQRARVDAAGRQIAADPPGRKKAQRRKKVTEDVTVSGPWVVAGRTYRSYPEAWAALRRLPVERASRR